MEPNKRKGRRFVPSFIPLEKDVIKTVNTFDGDKHMRAVRKPGDSKVYLYVSPLFYIAIQDFTRGRYSKETYAKKSEFTKFMDEKIPAKTRSHIKKYVQPKTQNIMGNEMHLVDLPFMTDKGNIYEMPFGKKRPEGETLSTALFENKDTMNISELRTIIKEEIANRLEVINEEEEMISNLEKFAIALKKSIDSNDRFTIRVDKVISEPRSDKNPNAEFKYGSYVIREPWVTIANMLGLDFEGEEDGKDTYNMINKLMKSLRAKKLIHLDW